MNKVTLIGRLTKDPEIKLTSNQTQFCNFTIAVDRRFKDSNGQRQADFINCVAWKQTAVFIQKYFKKGNRIGISGSIQTRSYDKDGQKVFITEVLAEEAEFVEAQQQTTQPEPEAQQEPEPEQAPAAPQIDIPDPRATQEVNELPFEI